MSVATQVVDPQSASLALTLLQSKAGNRWARAVEEMKTNRLRVAGDFPEFIVTNKSGTAYKVRLDPHGNGSCTCPDFQVRTAQEGRICKHIAAAAITALAPQTKASSPADGNGSVRATEAATANQAAPALSGTAKPPVKYRATSAKEGSPVHAVITKIDRMKTRQGDSLFLKVDVGGETVRVFGRPEELAERLEASGYDIPASEIEAGMELHLPCLVKVGQRNNGYKNIEEFLPEAAQ